MQPRHDDSSCDLHRTLSPTLLIGSSGTGTEALSKARSCSSSATVIPVSPSLAISPSTPKRARSPRWNGKRVNWCCETSASGSRPTFRNRSFARSRSSSSSSISGAASLSTRTSSAGCCRKWTSTARRPLSMAPDRIGRSAGSRFSITSTRFATRSRHESPTSSRKRCRPVRNRGCPRTRMSSTIGSTSWLSTPWRAAPAPACFSTSACWSGT